MTPTTGFAVGDRVLFVAEANGQYAADDPLYEPVVPAGAAGIVVKVADDHIRVRLDDPSLSASPVRLWFEGVFPDASTNTVSCLRRLD